MLMKVCSNRGELRPLDDFHIDRQNPDGLSAQCKVCRNTKDRHFRRVGYSWWMTNRERELMNKEIDTQVQQDVRNEFAFYVV